MASPDKPADLPKSTHDTTHFSFGCKNIRDSILFLVAIMDRLTANAVRLELKGQSMRRKNQK